jgi:hypothetical protein
MARCFPTSLPATNYGFIVATGRPFSSGILADPGHDAGALMPGRFDRRCRPGRAIAPGRSWPVRRGERAPRDGGVEGASSVAVAVAAGRSVRRR